MIIDLPLPTLLYLVVVTVLVPRISTVLVLRKFGEQQNWEPSDGIVLVTPITEDPVGQMGQRFRSEASCRRWSGCGNSTSSGIGTKVA